MYECEGTGGRDIESMHSYIEVFVGSVLLCNEAYRNLDVPSAHKYSRMEDRSTASPSAERE